MLVGQVLVPANLSAQTYPFKHYSTADGLVQATVKDIYQDSRGFLWFGTYGGVSKYDGVQFTNYIAHGAERSIIYAIWEDEHHTMWFATHGNGIAQLHEGDSTVSWIRAEDELLPSNYVPAIHHDRRGNIWVGTWNGILVEKPGGGTLKFDRHSGLPHDIVRSMAEEEDGTIWIGTDGGLIRCRLGIDDRLEAVKILDAATLALIVLRNGDVLAGTFGQGDVHKGFIARYRSGHLDTVLSYETYKQVIKGLSFCEDREGVVWIGTSSGIYLFHNGLLTQIRTENGLENEYVSNILEDREGNIWLATENGVAKLVSPRFVNYTLSQGLSSYIITAMMQDGKNNFWFGTYGGLTRLDPYGRSTRYGEEDGLRHRVIHSLAEDARGNIWIGTAWGLNICVGGRIRTGKIDGLRPSSPITGIVADPDGAMWVGTKQKLIKVRQKRVEVSLDSSSQIPPAGIVPFLVDRSGRVWFSAGNSGGGYYANGRLTLFTTRDGLPSDDINCFYEDNGGTIWVTTSRGAARLNNERFEPPSLPSPISDGRRVTFFLQDVQSHYWFGTEYGIYEWGESTVSHYDSHDGLAADVVPKGIIDREGNLWFGTHGGVSRLEKAYHSRPITTPDVYFEDVTIGDAGKAVGESASIPYTDRTIQLGFNALSFIDEEHMQFQWMMEGFDRDWFEPRKQHQVRYTNLSPGNYTFTVRAANRNGAWSRPARFSFSVLSPFWQTWWFLVLSISVIMSLAYLIHRYRVNQLLKVERLRTRIASDLHDDFGSNLSAIALMSDLLRNQLPSEREEKHQLSTISLTARQMADSLKDTVWSINPEYDKLDDILLRMKDIAATMLGSIEYTFHSGERPLSNSLNMEFRRSLLLIYKEMLNNIVKHAHASIVSIETREERGMFQLIVRDNGVGFDAIGAHKGNGLKNMRSRAGQIGGSIEFRNGGPRGMIVTLSAKIP